MFGIDHAKQCGSEQDQHGNEVVTQLAPHEQAEHGDDQPEGGKLDKRQSESGHSGSPSAILCRPPLCDRAFKTKQKIASVTSDLTANPRAGLQIGK